jgi:predicted MPP superfamily phosphohydrolase
VAGIDSSFGGRPDIKSAIKDTPNDAMKILLIHEPDFADNIKNHKTWIPLQLSGHSHGGQIRLPIIGAPVLPPFGKKYPMGLQYVSGTDRIAYTSKGVGVTLPVRFNCRPEVTILTLSDIL